MVMPETFGGGRAYADPQFGASHSEYGEVIRLARSEAVVLLVPLLTSGRHDAFGPYPLLSTRSPDLLVEDLVQMRDLGAVTFTAVLDPMEPLVPPDVRWDIHRPYKTHFLTVPGAQTAGPSRHHRRELRVAASRVSVSVQSGAEADIDRWFNLWDAVQPTRSVAGMRSGSRHALTEQFGLSGAYAMWATAGGVDVAAQLVLFSATTAYAHLAVSNRLGREARAMYALDAALVEMAMAMGLTVHWGGAAGPSDTADGLTAYKRGWSNASRTAWIVGSVLDPDAYLSVGGTLPVDGAAWFPPYRSPISAQDTTRSNVHVES
jgi:hypothetical protein